MRRNLAVTLTLLSIAAAAASPVFRADSQLPQELQTRVLAQIHEDCPKAYELSELETTSRENRVDQGVIDVYYTTKILARWNYDGMHPDAVGETITVESAEYAVSNPSVDRYEVKTPSSDGGACR